MLLGINGKKIKSITFYYPELMAKDAKEKIKEEYISIFKIKEKLFEARELVRNLEKELESKEESFRVKQKWFSIDLED